MYYFCRNASTEQIPDLIIARKDRYFREISFFSILFLKGGNNFFQEKETEKSCTHTVEAKRSFNTSHQKFINGKMRKTNFLKQKNGTPGKWLREKK